MYNVGDVVIYSSHGLCQVEDIVKRLATLLKLTTFYNH
ncbi:hypothetical protein LSPH24S_00316 [Lysinibacillus sphaericus]